MKWDQSGHTRRELLRTAVAGAAGVAFGLRAGTVFAQQGATARASVERLADDLYVLRLPGQENVLAQTTRQGVVLVDGGSAAGAEAMTKAVAALPGGGDIATLFNTHWHPEQTGLNEQVGQAGRPIVAHENTRLWLTTDVTWPWNGQRFKRLPKLAQPNKTFYTTGKLESGVQYGYVSDAAHTDGDMYVYFPQQNVLAVGGVMSGDGWPVVDYITGGWIGGIVGGLQRLQTIGNEQTRIVASRGPVLTVADLKAQTEMYGSLYERLTQMLNKGRSPGEAVDAKPAKEFEDRMGNSDEFVRRSFESLWAYLSPDA